MNLHKSHIRVQIQFFLHFLFSSLKIFEHKSCFLFKTLQFWFWTKVHLSNDLKFIFKTRLFQFERYFKYLKSLI